MRFLKVSALLLVLLSAACSNRSHIRGCELAHPYHQAAAPTLFLVPDGLDAPRSRATFHVPDQKFLEPKSPDLVTAEDVENLTTEQLLQKRCIVSPPVMKVEVPVAPAPAEPAADEPAEEEG